MNINIKKLREGAIIPTLGTDGAACYDLYVPEDVVVTKHRQVIPLGLSLEIPKSHYAEIRPRSGCSAKGMPDIDDNRQDSDVIIGTIDSDYRGEVGVILVSNTFPFKIAKGTRIAQMLIAKHETATFVETDTLSETDRGTGGFNSTGTR